MRTTSVRIDVDTHQAIKELAEWLGTSVGKTVAIAVRRLRQDQIGRQLRTPLTDDELAWLDADFG